MNLQTRRDGPDIDCLMLPGGIGRRSKPASAHMRKYSFANEQRPDLEKLYQLKRSNTIKEEVGSGGLEKESGDGGRLARIKRQIQSQWDQSTSMGAHSAEAKYETMKDESPASTASNPDEADSDSASSSSTDFSSSAAEMAKQRLSPPTQVSGGTIPES